MAPNTRCVLRVGGLCGGRHRAFVLVASFWTALASATQAATIVWRNTATSFNSGTSWTGGTPSATNLGSFTAATATYNPRLTGNISILGLSFASGTAGWTFTGLGRLAA